jgi:hypothetical protein
MGFGILILGYFLMYAFSISSVYFFADIIGTVIVLFAFSKLAQYNRYFVGAMGFALGFLALCTLGASSLMFDLYEASGIVAQIVGLLKNLVSAGMHILMFLGIRGISLGAESEKLAGRAMRNAGVTLVYYASCIILGIVAFFVPAGEVISYMNGLMYLYSIVCVLLNLVLMYSCFGTLCPADEDENEIKRSRFAIINKINDKMDSFEKKNNEYKLESMRLAMEEANRRAENKKKKPKWKKKK